MRVRRQNVTMATITFQNYFRMYEKLAGMTGTAKTEDEEFHRIYNLEVVVDPDQQADDPRRRGRSRLQERSRQIRRGYPRISRKSRSMAARCWSAPPRSKPLSD